MQGRALWSWQVGVVRKNRCVGGNAHALPCAGKAGLCDTLPRTVFGNALEQGQLSVPCSTPPFYPKLCNSRPGLKSLLAPVGCVALGKMLGLSVSSLKPKGVAAFTSTTEYA